MDEPACPGCRALQRRVAELESQVERLAQHLWAHRDDLFTFLRQPGLDATNWPAEWAIRFGVILRKVWGGNRTWAGARAQAVLMAVWQVPAAGAPGPGLPPSAPSRHPGGAGRPPVTRGAKPAVPGNGSCYTDRRPSGPPPVRRGRGLRCRPRTTCCSSSTC
jgi:hypothetical protein